VTDRTADELALLRTAYPDVEFRPDDLWARLPEYPLAQEIWGRSACEVAFRFPELPGQPPYGFWVRPDLSLVSGVAVQNYTFPVVIPFGEAWGQFSWSPDEWLPGASVRGGSNILRWVQSFALRLAEGS
jgi:hypothetical protein